MERKARNFLVSLILLLCAAIVFIAVGFLYAGAADENEAGAVSPASLWTPQDSSLTISSGGQTPDYAADPAGGVLVTSTMAGSAAILNNPVDITGGTREIISLMPLISYRGTVDFRNFTVRMTDAYDPDIWMQVTFTENRWWTNGTLVAVSTNSNTAEKGYQYGTPDDVDAFFESCYISFAGYTNGDTGNTYLPMKFSYNNETKTVYAMDHSRAWQTVLCLTDSDAVGYGNEWSGFESGVVNISVSANNFASAQVQYLILSVCGESMAGEMFADVTAPSLSVDAEELPLAKVGCPYTLPTASAIDMKDGEVEVAVQVRPRGGEYQAAEDSFTPSAPGEYELRYSAVDRSGNEKVQTYKVVASYDIPALSVSLGEMNDAYDVGKKIVLPSYMVSGGAGRVQSSSRVIRLSDNEEQTITNNSFTPTVAGEYLYTVTATDWNGMTQSSSVYFTVGYSDDPVILDGSLAMFPRFIDGVTVSLPLYDAFEVPRGTGVKQRIPQTITVAGTGEKSSYVQQLDGTVFTPSSEIFGDAVLITYTFETESGTAEPQRFTVPIGNATGLADYFETDNFTTSYGNFSDLLFVASGDAEAEFINPLNAYNAYLEFVIPEGRNNFEAMFVEFKDSENASACIRIELRRRTDGGNDLVFVDYGGKRYSMSGSFNTDSSIMRIRYNESTHGIYDYGGNLIFTVNAYQDGSQFEGFPSGKVRLSFGFTGVTGDAAVDVRSVSNQSMTNAVEGDPRFDYTTPTIQYEFAIDIWVRFGSETVLPSAIMHDELTPYIAVYLTVISPSGERLFDSVSADTEHSFTVTERGSYQVLYTGSDAAGNTLTSSYVIRAEDAVSPTIAVSGSEINVQAGNSVTIPDAIVQDDVDEEVILRVYIVTPHSESILITEDTYTPQSAGKYTIRYVAMDSSYNCTIVDVPLVVE